MAILRIHGYASIFYKKDDVNDYVSHKCFDDVIVNYDINNPLPLWYNHRNRDVLGYVKTIYKTKIGLRISGDIYFKDNSICLGIMRNTIKGLSISFKPVDTKKGIANGRILRKVTLDEISVVDTPIQRLALIDDWELL